MQAVTWREPLTNGRDKVRAHSRRRAKAPAIGTFLPSGFELRGAAIAGLASILKASVSAVRLGNSSLRTVLTCAMS